MRPRIPTQVPNSHRRSKAPYNFVPLPDQVYVPQGGLPDHAVFAVDRHSGHITIQVTAETPIYTRAGVPPDQAVEPDRRNAAVWGEGSPYRDFFHHGDKRPVIPGSLVRGMLRQLVEVLSDARLETDPRTRIVYRAVGEPGDSRFGSFYRRRFVGPNTHPDDPNPNPPGLPQRIEYPVNQADPSNSWQQFAVHGGYLFRDGRRWFIRQAREELGETFVRVDDRAPAWPAALSARRVHQVWVVPNSRQDHAHLGGQLTLRYASSSGVWTRTPGQTSPPQPSAVPANLIITAGVGANKHMHCAIFHPDPNSRIDVPEEIRKLYFSDRRRASIEARDRQGRLLPEAPPTANVADERDWVPCFYMVDVSGALVFLGGTLFFRLPYIQAPAEFVHPADGLDLAESIFGTVRKGSVKGRVRFEDLVCDENANVRIEPPTSPPPLLAPKPACIQHYLVQESDERKALRHYDDDVWHRGSTQPTALRGFKFYWHRPQAAAAKEGFASPETLVNDDRAQRQRTVMSPVGDSTEFSGHIHFDNLSAEELGALLTALHLPDTLRHKIGMGRKLGFGSVKISVEEISVLNPAKRYASFFATDMGSREGSAPAFNAGRHDDSVGIADRAVVAFVWAMCTHRADADPPDDRRQALEHFWRHPRMRELAALLEWKNPPAEDETREVSVTRDREADQWRDRRILPPASEIARDRGVSGEAAPRPAEDAPRPAPDDHPGRETPAPGRQQTSPLNQGQTRAGTLRRRGSRWVAVFEGDPREAEIENEATVPIAARDGFPATFFVRRASKRGVVVRFEELAK